MHTIIAIVAVLIARERWWHMLVVPLYRPIYEVMRIYLLYAAPIECSRVPSSPGTNWNGATASSHTTERI